MLHNTIQKNTSFKSPHWEASHSGWVFFMLMHAACLGIFFVGASTAAVVTCIALYLLRMFAITGFYHRYFSHRTFKTSRVAQAVFAFWGATAAQQGPIWWAANHRHHHKYSDQPEDIHSPVQKGFWYSHIGWITAQQQEKPKFELTPDLTKYPELMWLEKNYLFAPFFLGVTTFSLGAILEYLVPAWGTNGMQMLVWGFFVSTVLLYHGTFSINSLSHVFGSRRYNTKDHSRNNFWFALLTLGEGWHNNHHYYASSCRQGFYWWEIDITYYGLWLMSKLGIIWDIKSIPPHLKARHAKTDPR